MRKELQEFSLMIDEQLDLTDKRTRTFWTFLLNLFK